MVRVATAQRSNSMQRLHLGKRAAPTCLCGTPSSYGNDTTHTGFSAKQLFGQGVSYTYDDVIMLPGFIDFAANQVIFCCGGDALAMLHRCVYGA